MRENTSRPQRCSLAKPFPIQSMLSNAVVKEHITASTRLCDEAFESRRPCPTIKEDWMALSTSRKKS